MLTKHSSFRTINLATFIHLTVTLPSHPQVHSPSRLSPKDLERAFSNLSHRYMEMSNRRRNPSELVTSRSSGRGPQPDPDPEPPAAPPIIILAEKSNAQTAPHQGFAAAQPPATSSADEEAPPASRHNLRTRRHSCLVANDDPEPPDPFPAAPPVIILSNKRPASASPPRSPSSIQVTTNIPPSSTPVHDSAISTSPAVQTVQSSNVPTHAIDSPNTQHPEDTNPHHKHDMGSKGSKLTPAHGKLQPSRNKSDKAEMKEPSNYYTHRSKSMRRKAGKTGASSGAGGAGGGAGGMGGL